MHVINADLIVLVEVFMNTQVDTSVDKESTEEVYIPIFIPPTTHILSCISLLFGSLAVADRNPVSTIQCHIFGSGLVSGDTL